MTEISSSKHVGSEEAEALFAQPRPFAEAVFVLAKDMA
jgi:hypothetical protein